MTLLRFSLAALGAITLAAEAHAQAGPAPPARLDDIQVSQSDDKVTLLVKFTQQPRAASAKTEGDALVLDIDGVSLAPFTLDPPAGNLIDHVAAEPSGDGGSLVTLSGAALSNPSAVVYRNAVLIEAKLAEPKLAGASLLAGAAKPVPKPASAPAPTKPLEAPKPVEPPKPAGLPAAARVGIDAAACTGARTALDKDAWDIKALGDHALCLIDNGKFPEAKNRLEQLATFAPDDWRALYGRAALSVHDGQAADATAAFDQAKALAPDEKTREAIALAAEALAGLREQH